MLSRRTATRLFAGVIAVLLATRAALAQVPANSNLDYPSPSQAWEDNNAPFSDANPGKIGNLWPWKPGHVGSYAQPFAPAQTSAYGNGPRPNIGWFFSYERLYWSINKPETAVLGSETAAAPVSNVYIPIDVPAYNSVDTSKFTANGAWGNRWEVGYVDNNNTGWMVSVLDHVQQSQYHIDNAVQMQFTDPGNLLLGSVLIDGFLFDIGKMATIFSEVQQQNITTLNGVDASRIYRAPRLHNGGYFEVLYGPRWFQIYDAYIVNAFNGLQSGILDRGNVEGNPLADSNWSSVIQNNLVGGEIGLRWFKQTGRFITSVDGRFFAAANFQNMKLKTRLGTENARHVQENNDSEGVLVARQFLGLGTDQGSFITTFAPMGELRVNASYAVTAKVSLKVGYTGMVAGGIGRASNRLDYDQTKLITISDSNEHQIFFVNGLNFGVEVNR
jgi:hypothetical protein